MWTVLAWDSKVVLELSSHSPVTPQHQLLIKGVNHSPDERILVIRIDDMDLPGYAHRANIERIVPPGPFRFQLGFAGLHTPSGRPLRLGQLKRVYLFQGRGSGELDIETPQLLDPVELPAGAKGWDLGADTSQLWPGFEAMGPDYPDLSGVIPKPLDRGKRKQAADPLTDDGIKGIGQLRLPLKPGRWFVTLWLRDPGEWEYLPHPLSRRVHANGQVVWQQHFNAKQWIDNVYLAGKNREARIDDDVWSQYGKRPEGRISFQVEVEASGLLLEFDGGSPEAGFLAGVLAEPYEDYRVRKQVEQQRAQRWRENWRITSTPPSVDSTLKLQARHQALLIARGTVGNFLYELSGTGEEQAPLADLKRPSLNGIELEAELRWGQWRLQRTTLSGTSMRLGDDYLRGGKIPAVPTTGLSRRLHIRVYVPEGAPSGRYRGELKLQVAGRVLQVPIDLTVPDLQLPPPDRPVGVYLDRSVHFGWFDETKSEADKALACDLNFLRRQGLSGLAPPMTTPADKQGLSRLISEVSLVRQSGYQATFLAYAPFKRLVGQLGLEKAASRLAAVETELTANNLPGLLWAIADEPGNPGSDTDPIRIASQIRAFHPKARLAGQLNHPGDEKSIEAYDVALINAGYGVNKERIRQLTDKGVEPWLYNMEQFRAAAGFFLWRSSTKGYLQWHARMPTADPFDPTDGREDDVQLLLPHAEPCPEVQDVDKGLFDLAEGIVDLRWLLWLEQQANENEQARLLLERLKRDVPNDWLQMQLAGDEKLDSWRSKIIELAMKR